jgi:hypothetical protein
MLLKESASRESRRTLFFIQIKKVYEKNKFICYYLTTLHDCILH